MVGVKLAYLFEKTAEGNMAWKLNEAVYRTLVRKSRRLLEQLALFAGLPQQPPTI